MAYVPGDPILGCIELPADMACWDRLLGYVQSSVDEHLGDSPKAYGVLLASEELLSNMIRAAADRRQSDASTLVCIRIRCWISEASTPRRFVIEISDDGAPFDPCFAALPDSLPDLPVDQRPIGGLGLFLVKSSVDEVSYCCADGRNTYEIATRLP